jgi:hypothetical protein
MLNIKFWAGDVGAGAALHCGSNRVMRLLAALAPPHWLQVQESEYSIHFSASVFQAVLVESTECFT